MNIKKIVCVLVFLMIIFSATITIASIMDYYGKVEGVADVSCNPDYKWCEGDTAIICVDGKRIEVPCEDGYVCIDGICLTPTPTPTEIP